MVKPDPEASAREGGETPTQLDGLLDDGTPTLEMAAVQAAAAPAQRGGGHRAAAVPTTGDGDGAEVRRSTADVASAADRAFHGLARGAGLSVLVTMGLIGLFLLLRSLSALHREGVLRFLTESRWLPAAGIFGIAAVLLGTVLIALVALVIAVPTAFGAAVYISEYAPVALKRPLVALVDLMAAIPSIVYALWGFFFLQPRIVSLSRWLATHLAFIPLFKADLARPDFASSTFIAGVVVSLMVVPIVTSLMREVFSQAPTAEREAALALGGSRWGVIRTVVLPFGRGGMVGATMLGLGRALGETIAVYLIISPIFAITFHILQSGGNSIAALIALQFPESDQFGLSALMAAGLVLFALTLAVNSAAAAVIARSRSGSATEI